MKKNFVRVMLFGALTLAVSTTVTSCKDYDDDIKGLQEQVDNIKSTNPVSTEDMKAAIEKAQSELQGKLDALTTQLNDKAAVSKLEAEIKRLEDALKEAVGENAKDLAGELAKVQTDLTTLQNAMKETGTVGQLEKSVKELKGMQATLSALIAAESKYNASGDISGFTNTSFDKFVNQEIKDALSDSDPENRGQIAGYVQKAVQSGIAAQTKAIDNMVVEKTGSKLRSLSGFVEQVYNDLYGEEGAIKKQLDELDGLVAAINATIKKGQESGEDVYQNYTDVLMQIETTRLQLAALNMPADKEYDEIVQDIISEELEKKGSALNKLKTELQDEINAIKGMIQSIVYVPESADRTVIFTSLKIAETSDYSSSMVPSPSWHEVGNALEKKVRFRVSPASAVEELVKKDGKYTLTTDAQVLTRMANEFTVDRVEKVDKEPNLIEVTLKRTSAIEGKGYAVALTAKGKDSKTEYSDVSSDYFAMVQQDLYISKIEYAWDDAPTSLIKENADDKIDYATNGAYKFTVTSNSDGTSDTEVKTMEELGIDDSKFEVTYALGAGEEANFILTEGVLAPKATASIGAQCTVTPTIQITREGGTTELIGTAYPQVTLTSKGAPVTLVFDKLKWNLQAKEYTLTADGSGDNNLAGLTEILAALGQDSNTPATDLTNTTSVSDPADNAAKPCMVLENNAVKVKVPANYVTTDGIDKVSVILTKDNKTVTVSADITVSATTAEELMWDWNTLNATPGVETMLLERDAENLSAVTLTRKLTQAYEPAVFTDLNKRKNANEIVITPAISPLNTGSITGIDYTYTINAKDVAYTYEKEGKANPISVTFGVTSNSKSIAPADNKNVVTILVPVDELNGTLTLPKNRVKETSNKADNIELSKAFNPAPNEENEENGYNLTWKDSRDQVMWPEAANGKFSVNSADDALALYGLSIKFVPKSENDFKKYFDLDVLKNTGIVKLNTATAAQEIIGSDISAVIVLKATSKWGPVTGDGTEFTVTFKKGAK